MPCNSLYRDRRNEIVPKECSEVALLHEGEDRSFCSKVTNFCITHYGSSATAELRFIKRKETNLNISLPVGGFALKLTGLHSGSPTGGTRF